MEITEAANQFITSKAAPLLGMTVWGARLGVGSFITAEFGSAIPPRDEMSQEHGEWHLWITYAAWRLEQGIKTLAACEDSRPKIKAAIKNLNGLALLSVDVVSPALDTLFMFDDSVKLRVFPIYSEEYEHWQLFIPDGNVLTLGPNATWSFSSASSS